MAPILKTYSKRRKTEVIKENTFDKLLRSKGSYRIFDSSTEKESDSNKSTESGTSQVSFERSNTKTTRPSWLDLSELEMDKANYKLKKKTNLSNRIRKKRKKEFEISSKFLKCNDIKYSSLASSTPKIESGINECLVIVKDKSIVPPSKAVNTPTLSPIATTSFHLSHQSPTGNKTGRITPRNLLENLSLKSCDSFVHEDFLGFPSIRVEDNQANTSQHCSDGFQTLPESVVEANLNKLKLLEKNLDIGENECIAKLNEKAIECQEEKSVLEATIPVSRSNKGTSLDILVVDFNKLYHNQKNQRRKEPIKIEVSHSASSSTKSDLEETSETKQTVAISTSLQNLNVSTSFEKDLSNIVKSSSFEHPRISKITDINLIPHKINIPSQSIAGSILDSSDIEESVINSADERSYSLRSGQLDEEESTVQTSDEEYPSSFAKEKEHSAKKYFNKVDNECAVLSHQFKELEIIGNIQSEDASVEDCDLYTESEIAKSSDSIEVSRTANLENVSSDVSTSSDRDLLKDEESGIALSCNINIGEKLDIKPTNYNITRSCSSKSKDSSFYSAENSASDDSEQDCEYDSDCELSCESNRSSRRSSLESSKSLTREALEQLKESMCNLRVQDEYEDVICSKGRKSLTKRSSEWECPPSPRRSVFHPLAPLFPLPENQEDPTDDQGDGSMCDSANASEEEGSLRQREMQKADTGRSTDETGRSSGEEEGTKNSPVREATRLRRSRRLSRKKRETECRLNMVVEESDSESTEADVVRQIEHIVLPTGKKYRRSLTILKNLEEGETNFVGASKGRHYELSVDTVINLQSRGLDKTEKRKSLLTKRKSLLSQCNTPTASPVIKGYRKSLYLNLSYAVSPLAPRYTQISVAGPILEESGESSPHSISQCQDSIREDQQEDVSFKEKEQTIQEMSLLYEDAESELVLSVSSRDIVMKVCQQIEPIDFSNVLYGDWKEGSIKIGEGVYGEVFLIQKDGFKTVLKIIPIEGDFPVNGEKQKTYCEICNELLIAHTLSDLREENEFFMSSGFAELVSSLVVKGQYPDDLIDLWNEYDERRGSDNDSPTIFGNEQLYLVLQLSHAGRDLESYSFSTAKQGLSIFKQTVLSLAVAEANKEFEHRDLHWGNVLVSRTTERNIPFVLNKEKYSILTNGVKATIIDFTLSRMSLANLPVFCDLSQDPDMFIGTGDYQFDVYRHMKEDVQNNWERFVPKTNVRWLHYLVDKMINMVKYQRKTAKVHTDSMKILKDIESWILTCNSSVEVALKIVEYK